MKHGIHINWREDWSNLRLALRRFALALTSNKQLLALMLLAVTSLVAVVIVYYSDYRLHSGPWHTYERGLFSVNESRDEHFEKFLMNDKFKRELEKRGGGPLLCAYQKSMLSEIGEVREIQHINVFDLSHRFKHIYDTERNVYNKFLGSGLLNKEEYDTKRLHDVHGHPALAYKSKTRDMSGFYAMGVVVCAHKRAYFFEDYSYRSRYADWENDEQTYYYPTAGGYPENFSVDDMDSIEWRFFLVSLFLFLLYATSGAIVYRMFSRGLHPARQPLLPILNTRAKKRFNLMVAFTIVLGVIMFLTLVTFWQFKGVKVLTSIFYIALGIFMLSFNLPVLIHFYRKARTAPVSHSRQW